MRTAKRKRRLLRAAVMVCMGAGSGVYWAVGCAPAVPDGAGTCTQLDDTGNEFETRSSAVSAQGRELTLSRRVISNPEQDGGLRVETEVMADNQMIMTVVTTVDGLGNTSVQVEYGDLVPGLSTAMIRVEAGMVLGTIGGRSIVPMAAEDADPSATQFEDGEMPADDGLDPDLQAALEALFRSAEQADCESSGAAAMRRAAERQPFIPEQDDGKSSNPEGSAECVGCWAGCSVAAAGCIGGVSAGCVGALIFYAVCEAIGVGVCAAAYVGCVAACNVDGGPCCPVACGAVACCEDGETCLNGQTGVCCAAGKTPCAGENCCSSTQVCISSGPNAGICCESEGICGNTCCDPTDSCIAEANLCCPSDQAPCTDRCCAAGETCLGDGLCCDPQNACGSACCDELDSCIESLSLCCGFNSPACNDRCCDSGDLCLNGTTCCPLGRGCGDICCPAGSSCDSQTNTCVGCPNASDTPCTVGGCCPAGMNCTDFEGICCPQGETYCNGACNPISSCIN